MGTYPIVSSLRLRISGYSLNYTILLFVLFISVISTVMIANYYFQLRTNMRIKKLETIDNCQSGLNYLLALKSNVSSKQFDSVLSIGSGGDSIKLESTNWGLLQLIKSTGYGRNYTIDKIAFSGNKTITASSPILYLADHSRSLSLCQNTSLKGNVRLPNAGIRYELMNGINFSGYHIPEGNIFESNDTLPKPSSYFTSLTINTLLDTLLGQGNPLVNDRFDKTDSISNSFWGQPIFVFVENKYLDYSSARGNIVFIADSLVIISSNCKLEDVIIIAKEIRIEEGFEGTIQCFAKNRIIVGEEVILDFPSSLGLLPNDTIIYNADYHNPEIILEKNSSISGFVYSSYPYHPDIDYQAYLKIGQGSVLEGLAYWPGKIQLDGLTKGQVFTDSFYYKTALGTFRNFIVNGTMDRLSVEDTLSLPNCFESNQTGKVLKWLY